MESPEKNKFTRKVFTYLMQQTVQPEFVFPGGGLASYAVSCCIENLEKIYGTMSRQRIIDFCICQIHTLSKYGPQYLSRWKPNHSFGSKAQERYGKSHRGLVYYENQWLQSKGLFRSALYEIFGDRENHPLAPYIYPQSEDHTKRRLKGTPARFIICQLSTLLWTPLSPVCCQCEHRTPCMELTRRRYPELYRLRVESSNDAGL